MKIKNNIIIYYNYERGDREIISSPFIVVGLE